MNLEITDPEILQWEENFLSGKDIFYALFGDIVQIGLDPNPLPRLGQ